MPDLRQNRIIMDDFDRPDENPYHGSAQYPWRDKDVHGLGDDYVKLREGALQGAGFSSAWAYWDGDVMSGSSGDVPEVWARSAYQSFQFPYGLRMALMSSSGVGYANLETGGFSRILRRYTGGGAYTDISGNIDGGSLAGETFVLQGCIQLLRLTSTHFEVWRTTSSGDDTTWALSASVPDTTYRDNMLMWLGSTGNEDGWTEFGGGSAVNTTYPQIIRRSPRLSQYGGSGRIWTP